MRIDPGGGGRLLPDPPTGWHSDPPPGGWKFDPPPGGLKCDPGGGGY
ncbi:hypothetical protein ACUXCC_003463 [Cytobacillus horneckiae]|nr:hypothetical protein [Cytobacillus horneckiae]MBN6889913.1 hypothetical protein [Cytobacillus horneckiae]